MSDPTQLYALRLRPLTFVDERDGVMVGRPDTGSYALFPKPAATLLADTMEGRRFDECRARYEREAGVPLDVDEFEELLDELGFTGDPVPPVRVRWQRLGRWTFGPAAWTVYALLAVAALAVMVRDPASRPGFHDVFFTSHLSLIAVVLTTLQFPCVLIHESFHALAGRRLGLPSTLGIGRRLYFLVAETRMDSLYSVPARRRYLPFLAGMLADTLLAAGFVLLGTWFRHTGGAPWLVHLALALAYTCLIRLVWQAFFYLETDLYYVAATALGCTDLQAVTRARVTRAVRRLLRRPGRDDGWEETWTPHDRAVSRVYAPLLVAGYAVSIVSLVFVAVPISLHFWVTILHRFQSGTTPGFGQLLDSIVFMTMSIGQAVLLTYVTVRDYRSRRRATSKGH